jgi:hypothetical protein
MARGALRLPNTSGPVPVKSNTALPCQRAEDGRTSPAACLFPRTPFLGALPARPDLTQVDLHAEMDGGAIVHVVLCGHLKW